MYDDQAVQREQAQQIVRREMERKSLDVIRVYNPLDESFRFMYDSRWFSVPSHGTKDIERFLARHYFHKISEYIIGQQILEKGDELIKKRESHGLPPFLNKYDENKAIWDNTPRLDNPELLEKIGDTVILGLVEEYGLDLPEVTTEPDRQPSETVTDAIFKKFDRKIAEEDASDSI